MEPIVLNPTGSGDLPLSLSQREVWLDQRAWSGSTHLYIGGVAFLEGALNQALLREALALLVTESDALRMIPNAAGRQVLRESVDLPFDFTTLNPTSDLHRAVTDWWNQTLGAPFTWEDKPPWRFALISDGNDKSAIIMQYHHLTMDGWGTARLIQRWSEIYNLLEAGESVRPALALSYSNFIEESNDYRQSPAFAKDGEYWQAQLPVLPPMLVERIGGPAGRAEASPVVPSAWIVRESIAVSDYARLKQLSIEHNSTAFNYFLAALAVYFSRVSSTETVVIGVPSLNRAGRRYRDTLGMFVGVFPVVVHIQPGMTVGELLSAISLTMRGALRHARYPLSEVGRKLELMRHGRDGVFDILLSFERQDYDLAFGGARMAESRQLFCGKARYPLGVTVCEFQADQDLELILEASQTCFEQHEVANLAQRLWHLVDGMMIMPDGRVDDLKLLKSQRAADAALTGIQSPVWHPTTVPFITQFEQQVKVRPLNVALVWDGGSMTYAELDERANQLAQRLLTFGAQRDSVIAVAMDRCAELVVALFAVAKSGAAFLPLDPDAPLARLSGIVLESGASAVLIQEKDLERMASLHARMVVTTWSEALPGGTELAALPCPLPNDLAYVLFTSGSTGRPKGVMVEHGNLSCRLAWLSTAYGVVPNDRSALSTQITFDPSLIELCLPLVHGGSVALPPPGRLLPEALAEFVIRHSATIVAFVPSTLSRFLDRAGGDPALKLRVACCGGEVLPAELVNRYLSTTHARLFNVYGPTEACIFATAWECVKSPAETVLPIGLPVDDTVIYVLSAQLEPVSSGQTGEIFIGGGGVGRGYMRRPDLNVAAFLSDPFRPGARMYRTGDRGWFDKNGSLHFVGRLDRQIKLRGYRIELGEIEAALTAVEGVEQAAVKAVLRNDRPALHAWVVTSSGQRPDGLQRMLRLKLPDYMIPGGISVIQDLPKNDTGKIDYAALQDDSVPFVPMVARMPQSDLERQLLTLWQEILGVQPLTVLDNFFDVGGDSMAALSILTGTEKLTGERIPMSLLSENPTIEQLANALQKPAFTPSPVVSFNVDSNRIPIYIAASGHGDLLRFQNLAQALEDTCDIRMLKPPMGKPITSIVDLAHVYADLIEEQGALPGYVAGFSVAGITAMETACILGQRELPILGLVLIDTIYPRAIWGGTFFWRCFVWFVRRLRLQDLTLNGRRLGAMVNDEGLVGQVNAMTGYRPRRFEGQSLLIKTSGLARWDRWFFKPWRAFMRDTLTEAQIEGLHGSVFESGRVAELAAVLRGFAKR